MGSRTTYFTFHAHAPYGTPDMVADDFAAMAANREQQVEVYTVPPLWLLDLAQVYRLRVMIGLPWEQNVAFLNDADRIDSFSIALAAM